jgi:hypothetical protein
VFYIIAKGANGREGGEDELAVSGAEAVMVAEVGGAERTGLVETMANRLYLA